MMGILKELETIRLEEERLEYEHMDGAPFRRDQGLQDKLLERIREGDFDLRFQNFGKRPTLTLIDGGRSD